MIRQIKLPVKLAAERLKIVFSREKERYSIQMHNVHNGGLDITVEYDNQIFRKVLIWNEDSCPDCTLSRK